MHLNLFIVLLLSIGWIWGIKALFSENMLLESVGDWIRSISPSWVRKPLIDCPPCMSSLHGTAIYWILYPEGVWYWFFFLIVLCGMNFIIKEMIYD